MKRSALRILLAFLCALGLSIDAGAQLFRAYLAIDGNDANPCTLQQPCRLLPAAIAAVGSFGEVWMLDSANYNTSTVTIGKSVTVLAVPGTVGSVLAVGGPAIAIAASGLTVALRNLVVAPLPGAGGTHGIHLAGASNLIVEDSRFANLANDGVVATGGSTASVTIANTTFQAIGGSGVRMVDGRASVSGSRFLRGNAGVWASTSTSTVTAQAVVSDSVFSGMFGAVVVDATGQGTVLSSVTRCTIDNTTFALTVNGSTGALGKLTFSASTLASNGYSWYMQGAGSVVASTGDNHVTEGTGYGPLTTVGTK